MEHVSKTRGQKTGSVRGSLASAMHGLTEAQKNAVRDALPAEDDSKRGRDLAGWSVYRMPSIRNPPTTLRVHHRDPVTGKLLEVVSITEPDALPSTRRSTMYAGSLRLEEDQ
jgi:hypothetical protein